MDGTQPGFGGMVGFPPRAASSGMRLGPRVRGQDRAWRQGRGLGSGHHRERRRQVPEWHRRRVRRLRESPSHWRSWCHRLLRPHVVGSLHVHLVIRVGDGGYQRRAPDQSDPCRDLRHRQPAVVVPARARWFGGSTCSGTARWTAAPRAKPAACSSRSSSLSRRPQAHAEELNPRPHVPANRSRRRDRRCG